MPTTAREGRQERNSQIIEDFYEEGLSYTQLATKYGVSMSMVRKLVALDLVENGPRERTKTSARTCKFIDRPISGVHAYIGHRVGEYMERSGMTPTSFGLPLNMSRHRISGLVRGSHDLTLGEMQVIAKQLGLSLHELCSPKEIRLAG